MTTPDFTPLEEQVLAAMERLHVPGVAVGILHGRAEYHAGFGVTNVDHPLPIDADTLFQIGSTTKTVTGTAVMRLVEQGKLDLDVPVRTYLPELRLADEQVATNVTLRHLLTHTGGWLGDHFDDTGNGDDALARIVGDMAELPQLTPLGAVWSYNNAGFYLAGRVLEVVTGRRYEDVARQWVLEPLGMEMSFFFPGDVITHRVAAGHTAVYDDDKEPEVAQPWPVARNAAPVGGIISTVADQLRYARFHLGDGAAPDGTPLLSPYSMALMKSPLVPAANDEFMGLSWFVHDVDGKRLVRHGGATMGQLSGFLMAPAERFAITVLTNSARGGELHRDLIRWALEHYLGIHQEDPQPLSLPDAELKPFAGRYDAALGTYELKIEDGGFRVQVTPKGGFPTKETPPPPPPPPVRGALCGQDRLLLLEEPFKHIMGEFLRDPEGAITWLRIGGRIMRKERGRR
jgi:CubicO group peptidase (beta-lactamase class C family)